MNHDRINELYEGTIFDDRAQRAARDRIHWICSQVSGEKVLDIGCSQGIVCLILAREGFQCIGIDAEDTAIEYAHAALEKEEKSTRERVSFQLADASQLPFDDNSFDTVIMGEILEHLTQPEKILREAIRLLKENGTAIITVPFGLNPHPDHKRTYYPLSFLELVHPFLETNSIDILHKYIIYTGRKVSSSPKPTLSQSLNRYLDIQKKVEERFLAKEEQLLDLSIQRIEKEKVLHERIASLSNTNSSLSKANSDLNARIREINANLAARDREIEKLINAAASKENQIEQLNQQINHLNDLVAAHAQAIISQQEMFRTSWRWRIGSIFIDALQLLKKPVALLRTLWRRVRGIQSPTPPPAQAISVETPSQQFTAPDNPPARIFPPVGTYSIASKEDADHATRVNDPISLGSILDEFTAACFRPECRLITFRPDNWQEVLEKEDPQAIFVESAWRGNEGSWQYRIAKYAVNLGDELFDLLAWARVRKIPTIFWNKEDPPHYERFIERAKLFEFVFTSDANCLQRYTSDLGHERVHPLPFAAQPLIHNPISEHPRENKACFAGTYYGETYPERSQDMEYLLNPALRFGLDIYDRQYGSAGLYAYQFRFPEIYQPSIKGRLDYNEMVQAYKKYRVFLNVNSIKNSPTMFSRRVFELLASGTPVISTYSQGIEELLGNDLVLIAESEADTQKHLEHLLDEDYWSRLSVRGIRKVMAEHTYNHRLKYILAQCGIELPGATLPFFTLLAPVKSVQEIENLQECLLRQTYQDFDVVLLSEKEVNEQAVERLRNALGGKALTRIPHYREKAMNDRILGERCDYFAIMSGEHFYGDNYLKDYALATLYSKDYDFLGKSTYYLQANEAQLQNPGNEFRPVSQVPTATLAIRKQLLDLEKLPLVLSAQTFESESKKILSLDRFNFIQLSMNNGLDPNNTKLVTV